MKNYASNNYYLSDYLAAIMIPIILIGALSYWFRENIVFPIIGTAILIPLLLIAYLIFKKLMKIEFQDHFITMAYKFSRKKILIKYSDIYELTHISAYRGTSRTVFKIRQNSIKKLTTTSVLSDQDFHEFLIWLKSKNENIEFKFLPSDSFVKEKYLNHTK
ncbi:MAG: hypothetical protein JXR82_16630 [Marinifilaceae bacterium]|nr:hypothetical protein [Marinifilaceae bacterium]